MKEKQEQIEMLIEQLSNSTDKLKKEEIKKELKQAIEELKTGAYNLGSTQGK